jgi:hypothetical protein
MVEPTFPALAGPARLPPTPIIRLRGQGGLWGRWKARAEPLAPQRSREVRQIVAPPLFRLSRPPSPRLGSGVSMGCAALLRSSWGMLSGAGRVPAPSASTAKPSLLMLARPLRCSGPAERPAMGPRLPRADLSLAPFCAAPVRLGCPVLRHLPWRGCGPICRVCALCREPRYRNYGTARVPRCREQVTRPSAHAIRSPCTRQTSHATPRAPQHSQAWPCAWARA